MEISLIFCYYASLFYFIFPRATSFRNSSRSTSAFGTATSWKDQAKGLSATGSSVAS